MSEFIISLFPEVLKDSLKGKIKKSEDANLWAKEQIEPESIVTAFAKLVKEILQNLPNHDYPVLNSHFFFRPG